MTATFAYDLPFGAQPLPGGAVRFRIWAPARSDIALILDEDPAGSGTVLPMTRAADGWFELVTEQAQPGSRYRYQVADGFRVPDPAARAQAGDVHDPSQVIDPAAFTWQNHAWRGRPWEETILYELHVGAFTPDGTFDAVRRRLDHLAELGVTAVELMPIADFPGQRNWGYDGVLPYAPDTAYGGPEPLKALIDEAHGRGLMVFIDVVYNHFGPEGNFLQHYAPQFFTDRYRTPWGAAIDFSRPQVRDFFIHNALYWLEEYRVDGLRLDAVHAIRDEQPRNILVELAQRVHAVVGDRRHVHLILENDDNRADLLTRTKQGGPALYTAQWNDDVHHALHVMLTGEVGGYYIDYVKKPMHRLGRGLASGFIYQGERSAYRGGTERGEDSSGLPPTAFVNFLQNHDQIGNRAFGERLVRLANPELLRCATALLLLAPQIPLLFMGEEWNAGEPFLYFCQFHGHLAEAVTAGRRQEFARFPEFSDPELRQAIPDPNTDSTFVRSNLVWPNFDADPAARDRLALVRRLLAIRRAEIMPRLAGINPGTLLFAARHRTLALAWQLGDGSPLHLRVNLDDEPMVGLPPLPEGTVLYESLPGVADAAATGMVPPCSVVWLLGRRAAIGGDGTETDGDDR